MATLLQFVSVLLLSVLLLADLTFSADPPKNSQPVPAPHSGADSAPLQSAPSPASGPSQANSPPAPPTPTPTPTPGPTGSNSSPTPAPSSSDAPAPSDVGASDINHGSLEDDRSGKDSSKESSDGMSSGKKAGIVVGVMVGAGLVGIGGFVYKRRQDNIRRTQYGSDARSGFL